LGKGGQEACIVLTLHSNGDTYVYEGKFSKEINHYHSLGDPGLSEDETDDEDEEDEADDEGNEGDDEGNEGDNEFVLAATVLYWLTSRMVRLGHMNKQRLGWWSTHRQTTSSLTTKYLK